MMHRPAAISVIPDSYEPINAESMAWAIQHQPTREAYRKCTGEDAGPVLDRYVAWAQENIIGDEF